MSDDFGGAMDEVGVLEVGESITIFAGVDGRRSKAKADCSPGLRRVRNYGSSAGASLEGGESKSGSSPGFGPVRNDNFEERASRENFDRMSPKELGEFAEAEFLRTVLKMGMAVTKPWVRVRGMTLLWMLLGS